VSILIQLVFGTVTTARSDIRTERVQFKKGSTSAVIKGQVKGYSDVDYLVRAAARRNESSRHTLTVTVTGKALEPTPATKDAVIPGTSFHTSTKIACVPYIEKFRDKNQQECEAFVIRRGFDGTATVEIPQENSVPRRILFVKGKPVASDSPYPFVFSRKDDTTIVTFDTDERYEIPDMLVFGG